MTQVFTAVTRRGREKGLRNLYKDQEAIVRTEHGTTDWFKTRKGVCQGCILSPYLIYTQST